MDGRGVFLIRMLLAAHDEQQERPGWWADDLIRLACEYGSTARPKPSRNELLRLACRTVGQIFGLPTTGLIGKGEVVEWLRRQAAAYLRDSEALAAVRNNGSDPPSYDPAQMAKTYRGVAQALSHLAAAFDAHGPLPPLPAKWYALPISGAGRCRDWPEGCGERTRRPRTGREAVLRHRDGCACALSVTEQEASHG